MADPLGMEIARLLLRATVGGTLIAHGVKHGRSLDGTAGWFESIGFRSPRLQASLSSVIEIGSGVALVLGLGTPLAAAAIIGVMAVAGETVHRRNGFFITAEGYEYVLTITSATAVVAALGAGPYSVDRLFGIDAWLVGVRGLLASVGLGFLGAIGQLAAFWRRPAS